MYAVLYTLPSDGYSSPQDHYEICENDYEAELSYRRAVSEGALCAVLAKIEKATEPHWMEEAGDAQNP